jgi:hypothetical protein
MISFSTTFSALDPREWHMEESDSLNITQATPLFIHQGQVAV